jgi:tRNA-specific 2-thiouridylase
VCFAKLHAELNTLQSLTKRKNQSNIWPFSFRIQSGLSKDGTSDLDLKKFLSHYIPIARGDVLDEQGAVIGHHDGALFLTLGERHGFTITEKTPDDSRRYIIARDIAANTITVSTRIASVDMPAGKTQVRLHTTSWVAGAPETDKAYEAQIRYHGERLSCTYTHDSVIFSEPVLVAPGQSVVLFEKDVCVGGGIAA